METLFVCHSFFNGDAAATTCGIASSLLRDKAFDALTRSGRVGIVRSGPERPLGPGGGERLRDGDSPKGASLEDRVTEAETAPADRESGSLGATF